MQKNSGHKMIMKRGDLKTKVKGDLTAIVWKVEQNVRILANLHSLPSEGNFYDERGKAVKPALIQDYNRHMGYADKFDHMMNSYSSSRWTWKWTKKLFFHLMDLTILISFIFLASCGSKLSHRQFGLILLRDLIQQAERVP